MSILLTGKPGIGKTAVRKKFIALYDHPSCWITTVRIPNPSGDGGLGFVGTNSRRQIKIVSHNVLLHVTRGNREMLPRALLTMAGHRKMFNMLSESRQKAVIALLQEYVAGVKLLLIEKLMTNAIYYVNERRIVSTEPRQWHIRGRHGGYAVTFRKNQYSCNRDLFNGKNWCGVFACAGSKNYRIACFKPSAGLTREK